MDSEREKGLGVVCWAGVFQLHVMDSQREVVTEHAGKYSVVNLSTPCNGFPEVPRGQRVEAVPELSTPCNGFTVLTSFHTKERTLFKLSTPCNGFQQY